MKHHTSLRHSGSPLRLIAGILVLAVLTSASGCAAPGRQIVAIGSYDMTEVDHLLSSAAPAARGMALVVVKDGKVIESAGYAKFGPGTVVDIGSASRWLAAAAMMTLVDEGTLALDDPVAKYLPEFTGDKAAITIRQLWSYDSGLPATDASIDDRTLTLEECVKRIATGPLPSLPGTTVSDGSVSIQVGARVCEVISGMTWQEFFRVRITEPLGMDSTSFNLMGFNRNPDVAGGARSTAEDYSRFLTMLLQGGVWSGKHILSEQAVAQIDSLYHSFVASPLDQWCPSWAGHVARGCRSRHRNPPYRLLPRYLWVHALDRLQVEPRRGPIHAVRPG